MPTNGLRYLRRVAALLAAGGVLAAGLLVALRAELPDTFVLEQGQPLAVESMPFLQAAPAVPAGSAARRNGGGGLQERHAFYRQRLPLLQHKGIRQFCPQGNQQPRRQNAASRQQGRHTAQIS